MDALIVSAQKTKAGKTEAFTCAAAPALFLLRVRAASVPPE